MALTATQKVTLAEITLRSYEDIEDATGSLTAEQETTISADIVTWATIRNSHVKLKGGRDGIDFDNERKRQAIRTRIMNILGFDLFPCPTVFALGSATRGL